MQRKLMAVCQWDGETRAKGKCPFSECTVCMSQVHIGWLVCVCKSPITMPAATFKTPLGSCTCFIKQFECKWIYSIDPFIRDWFRWYMWHYWSNSIWEPPGNSFRFQTSPACLCNSCTITFTHNTKLWRQWIDFNNNLYNTVSNKWDYVCSKSEVAYQHVLLRIKSLDHNMDMTSIETHPSICHGFILMSINLGNTVSVWKQCWFMGLCLIIHNLVPMTL